MKLLLRGVSDANAERNASIPTKSYYTAEQVIGRKAVLPEIVAELIEISRPEAVRLLSWILSALLSDSGASLSVQLKWAQKSLPPDWYAPLQSLAEKDADSGRVLFHRKGVHLVLQLALLVCRDNESSLSPEESSNRIVKSCFLVNDIVLRLDADWIALLPDEEIERSVCSFTPLMKNAVTGIQLDTFGESYALWEVASQSTSFSSALKQLKLPTLESAFFDCYGLPLLKTIQYTFAIAMILHERIFNGDHNPILLEHEKIHALGYFDESSVKKILSLLSQNSDELATRIIGSRQGWGNEVLPLFERPLIEIERAKYCCPDLNLIVQASIDRIFFLLVEAYPKGKFSALFGHLFAAYVENIFSETVVTTGPMRTLFTSPNFSESTDEVSDGVLFWHDSAAVIECKGSRLSSRELYAGLPEELLRGIRSMLATKDKGVGQLAKSIGRLVNGECLVSDGVSCSLSSCEVIYPVLVCYESALCFHGTRALLQREFDSLADKLKIARDRVGPLMLLSTLDLENLALVGKSIPVRDIFTEYSRFIKSQPHNHLTNLSRFMASHYNGRITPSNSYSKSMFDKMSKEVDFILNADVPGTQVSEQSAIE